MGVLNACVRVIALEDGQRAHEQIVASGWDLVVFVESSLIDTYAKCGSMEDTWKVLNKMPS